MKNPEMLNFVSDHLKTKQICNHVVKKIPYLLRYVPDQKLCDKAILENGESLNYVLDCCKDQEICNKPVDSNPHALESVSECLVVFLHAKR